MPSQSFDIENEFDFFIPQGILFDPDGDQLTL